MGLGFRIYDLGLRIKGFCSSELEWWVFHKVTVAPSIVLVLLI